MFAKHSRFLNKASSRHKILFENFQANLAKAIDLYLNKLPCEKRNNIILILLIFFYFNHKDKNITLITLDEYREKI